MAELENNGQSCLEKAGIAERDYELDRSDYNENKPYGPTHKDAMSDGDAQGKGTGHGGHTAWQPKCSGVADNTIKYDNFMTYERDGHTIGGLYDIKGRNGFGGRERAMNSSKYNENNPYGANLVNTSENIALGQYYIGQTIKHM